MRVMMNDIEKVEFRNKKWHEEQRKKPIHAEWYLSNWYRDDNDFDPMDKRDLWYHINRPNYHWKKHNVYKNNKKLIHFISKELKMGVVIAGDFLHLRWVIGGIMVDGTRAKQRQVVVNLNKIRGWSLDDKKIYIEKLKKYRNFPIFD